jgi:8-oxo-dGTP pyrophosphatase MutT (NUDIX family)
VTGDPGRTFFALAGGVYAVRGGKLLMLERKSAFMNGFWSVPGGMQDPGEEPQETALRELYEEAGLRPSGPVELVAAVHLKGYGMEILSLRFAAPCEAGDVRISDEHTGWGWFDPLEYREQHLSDAAIARWRKQSEEDAFSALSNRAGLDAFLAWNARSR